MSRIDCLIYNSFLIEIGIVLSRENEDFDENPSILLYFLRCNIWKNNSANRLYGSLAELTR